MNNVRGMTLKQLNDTLDQMHTVYPFKPETTRLGDFRDIQMDASRQVELFTVDEATGVNIIMTKGVDRIANRDD